MRCKFAYEPRAANIDGRVVNPGWVQILPAGKALSSSLALRRDVC